jgi:hypothetical protein
VVAEQKADVERKQSIRYEDALKKNVRKRLPRVRAGDGNHGRRCGGGSGQLTGRPTCDFAATVPGSFQGDAAMAGNSKTSIMMSV